MIFSAGFGRGARLAALSLETGEWHPLVDEGVGAVDLGADQLAYGEQGGLRLIGFDRDRLVTAGDPLPVLSDVYAHVVFGVPFFSVSRTGSLAYVAGRPQDRLVWVDRMGRVTSFDVRQDVYRLPRLSLDGTRLALVVLSVGGGAAVWVFDVERGTRTRLTTDGNSGFPVWSPDGTHVAFGEDSASFWRTARKAADGSGAEEQLMSSDMSADRSFLPTSWSPDGQTLALEVQTGGQGIDGWVFPLDGEPAALLTGPFNFQALAFSPDGKWMAYVSDETGRSEVYVCAYPGPGSTFVVSTNGGTEPMWSKDGHELFYRSGPQMMAVPISLDSTFEAGAPQVLFEGTYTLSRAGISSSAVPNYDVSLDGQRFLMIQRDESSIPRRIHIVLNWTEELKARVPTP